MKTENKLSDIQHSIADGNISSGRYEHHDYSCAYPIPEFIFLPSALRAQLETMLTNGMPLFLSCEPGADLSEVMAYIRARLQASDNRYVELSFDKDLRAQLGAIGEELASHKPLTLCFGGVDALDALCQQETVTSLQQVCRDYQGIRLLFCLHDVAPDSQTTAESMAYLTSALGAQRLSIPALKGRTQDINELIHSACLAYRQSARQTLHPDVLAQLQHYDWPGNVRQLWQSLARLLMLSDEAEIDMRQAGRILPHIMTAATGEGAKRLINRPLCDAILQRNHQVLHQFHPSVIKALMYLGEHFQREVTLIELADNAHISPSHLSYLLKNSLRLSFKQILNQVRIFYACQRLECHPMSRITNLYLDCGYGDLSHFEKMFKRYTGLTPIEFRKQFNPAVLRDETG
ncbi:AraC family transcriptional regulator [Dickeya lacustris]|uniref:Helix-turn-helix domain-containing protein n=1 Tax=Dickeya lacustris TaxID=2259638 RepID=A0ABY8G411_9GAMM|nr:AraC family transcriptional regulator [Dickeya lacustris]WFN54657.1 helix-turn-helix domain-containing protein [Dickeya lacustris]